MFYPKTILQPMNTSKACRAVVHVCLLGQTLQIICGHVAMYQCSWYAASWCDCWLSGCTQWWVHVVQITLLNDYCPAVGWYWWHCLARPCIFYGYMRPYHHPSFLYSQGVMEIDVAMQPCLHIALWPYKSIATNKHFHTAIRHILQGCTCLITLLCVATSYCMWSCDCVSV